MPESTDREGQRLSKITIGQDGKRPVVLRVNLGLVFPPGLGPDPEIAEAQGLVPHTSESREKFYLRTGVDLAKVERLRVPLPLCLKGAPQGELLLNKRSGCKVVFGREGEEETFGFRPGKFHIFLRISNPRDWREMFKPLYMVIWRGDESFFRKLTVSWEVSKKQDEQDEMIVTLSNVKRWEDLPTCLRGETPEFEEFDS